MRYLELTAKTILTLLITAMGWSLITKQSAEYPAYIIVILLVLLVFAWLGVVRTRTEATSWLYRILIPLASLIVVAISGDMVLSSENSEWLVAPAFYGQIAIVILAVWRPDWALWLSYALVWLAAVAGLTVAIGGCTAGPVFYANGEAEYGGPVFLVGPATLLLWILVLGGLAAWIAVLWHRVPVRWAFFIMLAAIPSTLSLITDCLNIAQIDIATYLLWLVLMIGICKMIIFGRGRGGLLARSNISRCKRAVSPRGAVEYKSYDNAG